MLSIRNFVAHACPASLCLFGTRMKRMKQIFTDFQYDVDHDIVHLFRSKTEKLVHFYIKSLFDT